MEEVVAEAVTRIKKRFPDISVEVSVPEELLIVPMDATLIEQVLINLVENAIRHSGSTLPVALRVSKKKSGAVFTVSDHGRASTLPASPTFSMANPLPAPAIPRAASASDFPSVNPSFWHTMAKYLRKIIKPAAPASPSCCL